MSRKKTYRINGDEVAVKAVNAMYDGDIQDVDNAQDAIDALNTRVESLESADAPDTEESTDIIYTEADATIVGRGIYSNGGDSPNGNYNCSDYITIPRGVKMYIKMNYTYPSNFGLSFYKRRFFTGDYSFVSSLVSIGPYEDYTEVTIPDLAEAFRFTHRAGADKHISIKFSKNEVLDDVVKLKIGAWNIGHFGGGSSSSSVTNENVVAMRAAYRKVFDKVDADILCISEYNPVFNTDTSSSARNEVFLNYPYFKIGAKGDAYNHNVVFSKLPIVYSQEKIFTTHGQNRYIKEVNIMLKGKFVKVVTTHLDEENDAHTVNYGLGQIQELVEFYANDPYVIIGADFNLHITDRIGDYVSGDGTDGYLNYKYLTEAGYTLLRFDYLDNDMLPNPLSQSTADNIAVKGFAMGKREFVYEQGVSETLSDHCMISCELVML